MLSKKVKCSYSVGINDLDKNLVENFYYASGISINLNISKVTVSKYTNKDRVMFKGKYYLKVNSFNE